MDEFDETLPLEHYLAIAGISGERPITYKRSHREIAGSVTAAVLLQQIIFWSDHKKGEPFYKFKQECSHRLWSEGDSWCEELGFSRHEFDGAIKHFAKKTKQGEMVVDGTTLVYYWTDMDRLTWYWLDRVALGKAAFRLYVKPNSGFRKSHYSALVHTENTQRILTENTKNNIDPMAQEDLLASIIATLSSVAKETVYHGNQKSFDDVADIMIGWDVTPEKINEFGELWAEHGHYSGKPALKSLLNNFTGFLAGTWPSAPKQTAVTKQPTTNGTQPESGRERMARLAGGK